MSGITGYAAPSICVCGHERGLHMKIGFRTDTGECAGRGCFGNLHAFQADGRAD